MKADSIERALIAMQAGIPVVVVDDEDRENEGDLIVAAEKATPESIAFMVRWTSGVLCVAITEERTRELQLPLMVVDSSDPRRTAFTVSVDLREGSTTGISAQERAATIRALADPALGAGAFTRPGHVFPLRAVAGGVLHRAGHTEASVDLARLAGLHPAGVLAEIVNDDGSMARRPALSAFAQAHGLPLITIKDLIQYRKRTEKLVQRQSSAELPTRWGRFQVHAYVDTQSGIEHVALTLGDLAQSPAPLVRVHSECLTSEVFGSLRCDCKPQLDLALERIAAEGAGVVIYLRGQEGRGIGLTHKLRAYALQDLGADTAEANRQLGLPVDSRDYTVGAQILADLGVRRLRLMTNNPRKYTGITDHGLAIVERVPLITPSQPDNAAYLRFKRDHMGHHLDPTAPDEEAPLSLF
ncbi:bifunctional 3,4-dihydroxy-2-butanone-4-phosphate synthase/GTP cyclohydrolase II [Hydrogenophaga sp. YM1]|uniref:bifunctional 3,4-dihydroxy-2-butanone-4-phosphate synthase/GTP cyclohydrolase II n=1 Tax=Hydrogenophaga sp. YM1 TaxID=2806262 RepID=UPI00195D7397|nr:bifunctional 3,4-dihydroxy-2-butanone-4-phosphate synthase/GTP cyclohydrolase II [Hydrogenophaga sp. YM1]QRR32471.1 bifunctional 3,4-dihydroxy-2-butanone-4-phosphate synthase/GTP cyclohydrolase II [Hydrogenophaga sp. YM1]